MQMWDNKIQHVHIQQQPSVAQYIDMQNGPHFRKKHIKELKCKTAPHKKCAWVHAINNTGSKQPNMGDDVNTGFRWTVKALRTKNVDEIMKSNSYDLDKKQALTFS